MLTQLRIKKILQRKIAGVLGKGEEDILASLNKEGRSQVEFGTLGKDLTKEKKEQIEALKLREYLLLQKMQGCIQTVILHLTL